RWCGRKTRSRGRRPRAAPPRWAAPPQWSAATPRWAASPHWSAARSGSSAARRCRRRGWSWRRHQPVADAAHVLHQQRVGRIVLDLAAQAVDLHVDGALAGRAVVAGERLPRHRLAGGGGEQAQHVALAIRQPHDLLAALELPAPEMEAELAEAHR